MIDGSWFYRPENVRRLSRVGMVVLALTVFAQLFVHVHGYFHVDEWFAFNAVYGFVSCVAMVLGAKFLGKLLKRPDTYYLEEGDADD